MLITEQGQILEVIDRYTFRVLVESGHKVNATISKEMIAYKDKELKEGDTVRIQYNSFDPYRGRIHRTTFINFLGKIGGSDTT